MPAIAAFPQLKYPIHGTTFCGTRDTVRDLSGPQAP